MWRHGGLRTLHGRQLRHFAGQRQMQCVRALPWRWREEGRSVDIFIWLVVSTMLKNISQWEGLPHIIMENKTCSKPPTSYVLDYHNLIDEIDVIM